MPIINDMHHPYGESMSNEDAPSTNCESCENNPASLHVVFHDDGTALILCLGCCQELTRAISIIWAGDVTIMPLTHGDIIPRQPTLF